MSRKQEVLLVTWLFIHTYSIYGRYKKKTSAIISTGAKNFNQITSNKTHDEYVKNIVQERMPERMAAHGDV